MPLIVGIILIAGTAAGAVLVAKEIYHRVVDVECQRVSQTVTEDERYIATYECDDGTTITRTLTQPAPPAIVKPF